MSVWNRLPPSRQPVRPTTQSRHKRTTKIFSTPQSVSVNRRTVSDHIPNCPQIGPILSSGVPFEDSYYESAAGIEQELIHRVLVKLWKSGTKVDTGVMGDNGRVYPLYADTIYVQWAERKDATGTPYRYLREALCLPELVQHEDAIEAGVIPSGVKVIEQDEAGIDPYVFLGLESIGFN